MRVWCIVGRGVMGWSLCAGALRSHHISAVSLAAHLVEQDEAHPHGVHGTMAARMALAGPELSAATRCRCMKAGRTHRSLSSMVLVCWGFATCGLGDTVLSVGGHAGTWCSATCQGTALAHICGSAGAAGLRGLVKPLAVASSSHGGDCSVLASSGCLHCRLLTADTPVSISHVSGALQKAKLPVCPH